MKTPNRDYAAIEEFAKFAIERHGNQMYGNRPYSFHLNQVVMALDEMGADDDEMKGGWGHDLLEDTETTHAEVVERSNQRVADMTWAVQGVGETREAKLQSVVKKIPQVPGSEKVKLADRYSNVRRCLLDKNWKKLKTYVLEHALLSTVLPPTSHPLRAELDRLIEQGRNLLIERGDIPRPKMTFTDRMVEVLEVLCTARPPKELCTAWICDKEDSRLQEWVLQHVRFGWAEGIGTIEAAMGAAEQCTGSWPDFTDLEDDRRAYKEQQKQAQRKAVTP